MLMLVNVNMVGQLLEGDPGWMGIQFRLDPPSSSSCSLARLDDGGVPMLR